MEISLFSESESSAFTDLVGHTGDVECLAWSPCLDHLLASGSKDKTVRVSRQRTVFPMHRCAFVAVECRNGATVESL